MALVETLPRDEQAVAAVTAILRQRLGDRLQTGQAIRDQHGATTTWLPTQSPDAVAFPEGTEEVADIVRICATHGVPVIAYGTGTSLEGHVNAPRGGVTLDLSRMNAILAVGAEDLDCTIQPGVTRKQLNEHLRDQGLFFPIDPGADASLGGMAATRASGTNAVRYGTMKDNVIALEVVLADGRVIRTASRARKSSAGYDLTRLFVGSEGTLGVITELTLRLHGIPEAISSATCSFPTVAAACAAVIQTIQTGIPVARMELLDALSVQAVNAYSRLALPETPLLLFEFHGSAASVAEQAETTAEIAGDCGGTGFAWTTSPEERTRLWQARHDAYWATIALRPGARPLATDVCVPISRLADCVEAARARAAELGLIAPIIGHVGDGNFHVTPLVDMSDPVEIAKTEGFVSWLADLAISMHGTCTGEHGIGQGKRAYLRRERGAAVDVMAAIKSALDPAGIMNPGKVL
jgi:D-lactate dehydrogenase (cytochrome)